MSDESDGTGDQSTTGSTGDSQVGHGNPPKHAQFKPGQSGNPNGRPKKKPSSKQLFLQALAREIPVTIDGRKQMMSLHEALIASSVDKAMKGTLKEKLALLKLVGELDDTVLPTGGSDIIDENGLLRVRINIGKPPGLLDPEPPTNGIRPQENER